jgi:hypothetical protein
MCLYLIAPRYCVDFVQHIGDCLWIRNPDVPDQIMLPELCASWHDHLHKHGAPSGHCGDTRKTTEPGYSRLFLLFNILQSAAHSL